MNGGVKDFGGGLNAARMESLEVRQGRISREVEIWRIREGCWIEARAHDNANSRTVGDGR